MRLAMLTLQHLPQIDAGTLERQFETIAQRGCGSNLSHCHPEVDDGTRHRG